MINVIGAKRLIIFLVLLLINISFAAGVYLYIYPAEKKAEKKVKTLRGQISTLQSDIDRMQIEFDQLDQQQAAFDALKDDGFFSIQLRSVAKEKLKDIQEQSKVISAVANVYAGKVEDNQEAAKAKYKILSSPIEIELKAFDDADIYNYIYMITNSFPGHLSVDSIVIDRILDVNATVLRSIATGTNPELLEAKIYMSWRTMIPEDQVIDEKG